MMKKLIKSSIVNKTIVADIDPEVLEQALSIFMANAETEINELTKNFIKENFKQVKSLAHKLGGSSITVGLKKFSTLAKAIENKDSDNLSETDIKNLKNEFLLIKELVN